MTSAELIPEGFPFPLAEPLPAPAGQIAYEAYWEAAGTPMDGCWPSLPRLERAAWEAAAKAVLSTANGTKRPTEDQ